MNTNHHQGYDNYRIAVIYVSCLNPTDPALTLFLLQSPLSNLYRDFITLYEHQSMNKPISTPNTPTHPYAIVSSSSALLTRSNSTNTKLPHHSFSPSTLPQLTSPSTPHRDDYRSHRYTKSLTSVDPRSLPPPPRSVLDDSESDTTSGSESYPNQPVSTIPY